MIFNSDWIEVDALSVRLIQQVVNIGLELIAPLPRQVIIYNKPDACLVGLPHLLIVVDVAVQSKHVEVHIDCKYGIVGLQVKFCF